MGRFLVRRLLRMVLVLWVISVITFALFFGTNPHPENQILPERQQSQAQLAATRARLHLNDPLYLQYWHFVYKGPKIMGHKTGIFNGSLGYSYKSNFDVRQTLFDRLPVTASLAIGAAVIWLAMGIPIGILAATKPRSIRDRVATTFALTGLSFPTFFLGLLLLFLFYLKISSDAGLGLHWFPPQGYVPLLKDPFGWAQHLILPWFTLAIVNAASYSRMTRGSMLEVLGEDYIRTARAKGLPERRVTYRHALRASLTPVVTLLGIDLGVLLGGAVVSEQIFGLNGIGKTAVNAVPNQDLPVLIGCVMFASFFIVVANAIIDILYSVLDPRVRLS